MGKVLWCTLLVVVFALFAHWLFGLCKKLGVFKEEAALEPGNCYLMEGIEYGSEDISVLPGGLALISSGLKYPLIPDLAPGQPGRIFLVDLNNPTLRAVELRISHGFEVNSFNPHGLSTFLEKGGAVRVFVVNHPPHTTTVEIFKFEEEQLSLTHLKTIQHELLNNVNDIIAVGSQSFYATNDHYYSNFYLRIFEFLFGYSWGSVVYYSPTEVKEVAKGLSFPNGLDISLDGKHLFVAETAASMINVLEINPNHSLTQKKSLALGVNPDNVIVDPKTGDIWTAGCLNAWKLLPYNPEDPPGSEVIKIENIFSKDPRVIQVYVNNGSVLQGASVATVYNDKLLIGTIYHKALYCEFSSL